MPHKRISVIEAIKRASHEEGGVYEGFQTQRKHIKHFIRARPWMESFFVFSAATPSDWRGVKNKCATVRRLIRERVKAGGNPKNPRKENHQ